ncbi:hypothetical protein [Vibrio navarrensis]|uniref:hypothetical protein n=1 Tax=Vibrio navarrensis TaxID=29495 RepID=UPI0018DBC4FF|nr:hypothetical protein [Vibrio navarrensis]MBH9742250.1 hypothetical protein [Vibrio navarrensis]
MNLILKRFAFYLFCGCFFFYLTNNAQAYNYGSYPTLSNIIYNHKNESSYRIGNAIEKGQSIPIVFNDEFKSLSMINFSRKYFTTYESEILSSKTFVENMKKVIGEFACAEFRYRRGLPESNSCNGYVRSDVKLEKMPFVDGQYVSKSIESNIDIHKYGIQMFLDSSDGTPLNNLFGSIKQMGTFFGNAFERNNLVLSISMNVYRLDSSGYRSNVINEKPIIYMVIIPGSMEISEQENQSKAAEYVIENSKLLVFLSE